MMEKTWGSGHRMEGWFVFCCFSFFFSEVISIFFTQTIPEEISNVKPHRGIMYDRSSRQNQVQTLFQLHEAFLFLFCFFFFFLQTPLTVCRMITLTTLGWISLSSLFSFSFFSSRVPAYRAAKCKGGVSPRMSCIWQLKLGCEIRGAC